MNCEFIHKINHSSHKTQSRCRDKLSMKWISQHKGCSQRERERERRSKSRSRKGRRSRSRNRSRSRSGSGSRSCSRS